MARRTITLEEKIEKAEAEVAATKRRHDAAVDKLAKLVAKQRERDDKKVLAAYHAGDKTADEIVSFIRGNEGSED